MTSQTSDSLSHIMELMFTELAVRDQLNAPFTMINTRQQGLTLVTISLTVSRAE